MLYYFIANRGHKEVKKHLSSEALKKLMKEEQKRGKILQRLIFINDLYEEQSVPSAAKHVGVVKAIAYQWLERWNESGISMASLQDLQVESRQNSLQNRKRNSKHYLSQRISGTSEILYDS